MNLSLVIDDWPHEYLLIAAWLDGYLLFKDGYFTKRILTLIPFSFNNSFISRPNYVKYDIHFPQLP